MADMLYNKYRPKTLDDVIGQDEAVSVVRGWLEDNHVPHSILLSGPSGVGKTTIARILKSELQCADIDFKDINAASSRGIDTIRQIEECVGMRPACGPCRIWLMDECHHLTRKKGGDAQTAFLRLLEECPSHAYFFLSTTNPSELLRTIRTRCAEVKLGAVSDTNMEKILASVVLMEGLSKKVSEEVYDKIIQASEGSPRRALGFLETVANLKTEEEQLEAIIKPTAQKEAFDIVKALLFEKPKWANIQAVLNNIQEEPEQLRRLILASAAGQMLKGKNLDKAYLIIAAFEGHEFQTGKAGLASLCRAAYEVVIAK